MPLKPLIKEIFKFIYWIGITMICAACETRKHFECIDCMSNHQTHLCTCDCHDENTKPHEVGKSH